ncbi:MAG: hypothetical protein ACXVRJ_07240 [Gaiellaceae bacterium]
MEALDSALPCKLDGRPCPGADCPFWLLGECLLVDVDLRGRGDLVAWLGELRRELGSPAMTPPSGSPPRPR